MKFQIGDPIVVKKTGEQGKIIALLDKQMLSVQVKGTTFPIFEQEVDHPYFYLFTGKAIKPLIHTLPITTEQKLKPPAQQHNPYPLGMKLIFVPVYTMHNFDDIIQRVKIYLSNNLTEAFAFNYNYANRDASDTFKINAEVLPHQHFYIHDLSYEQLATNPLFNITAAQIVEYPTDNLLHTEQSIALKPKRLLQYIQHMHSSNNAFFDIDIIEAPAVLAAIEPVPIFTYTPKPNKLVQELPAEQEARIAAKLKKTVDPTPSKVPPKVQELPIEQLFISAYEVDLHIEKLNPKAIQLNDADKLKLQLSAVQQAINYSINNKHNTLILIHGNGKGILRNKIHELLEQDSRVHSFVNKYDKRYGQGATEIFFGYH
jgi:hypothetical protein